MPDREGGEPSYVADGFEGIYTVARMLRNGDVALWRGSLNAEQLGDLPEDDYDIAIHEDRLTATRERSDRWQALQRVLTAAGATISGTGGGHEAWTLTLGDVHIIVTDDDGFTPGVGDDVLVGICADPEWSDYIDQHAFSWDSAAAGLADVLTALRGNKE